MNVDRAVQLASGRHGVSETMSISSYYARLRARVGTDLLLIPAVAAVVRDADGRVLVQQQHDGQWSLPAGAIEPGESPATAVARETFEETGLVVRPERVTGVMGGPSCRVRYATGDEVEYTVMVFDCAVVGGALRAIDETLQLAFLPVEDVLARITFTYPAVVLAGTTGPAYFERSA